MLKSNDVSSELYHYTMLKFQKYIIIVNTQNYIKPNYVCESHQIIYNQINIK